MKQRFTLTPPSRLARAIGLPLALLAALQPLAAQADAPVSDRAEVEQLRATTMALLQTLVDSGLLSRDKAEAIVRQAQQAHPVAAEAPAASSRPPVVRVPYVSETTKAQIREEVKQDVLAQARAERWGDPGALPDWLSRIGFEGDLRVRYEGDLFDKTNLPASNYIDQVTLNPNFPTWYPDATNTTNDRSRMTVRARFGLQAKLTDGISAGIRLATGPANEQASTSQTEGNGFNRYNVGLDRAFISWQPRDDVKLDAGRFGNPFFGTDLSWPDDLSFDGLAASYKPAITTNAGLFMTGGAFPLQESSLGSSANKWLYGAQIGGHLQLSQTNSLRVGLAAYNFDGLEGAQTSTYLDPNVAKTDPNYVGSEYAWRKKGNTLFNIYPPFDQNGVPTTTVVWGLASRFKPLDLTAEFTSHAFESAPITATFDFIKNTGWSHADIVRRMGSLGANFNVKPKTVALQARLNVGAPRIDKRGDWQAFLAWRRMERDAWVDAFTDTTWHLGGTNYQGYSFGGQYGIAKNTSLGGRWTSTHSLSDGQAYQDGGNVVPNLSNAQLKIDVLQLEINTRF